jgi:HlyD family secretion protein
MTRKVLLALFAVMLLVLIGWGGYQLYQVAQPAGTISVTTTSVKRGDVRITVAARGELQGGNSEMLTAPMTGGREMVITFLRQPGELVNEGETVVEFDTTEQEFSLREAEADLAEAEQQVIQAQAESEAKVEETGYELLHAKTLVRLAELDVRLNPVKAAIVARQNTLALEAAKDRLRQLEQDIASRKATTEAGVAIQEAARNKAKVKAETARRNIEAMTLRAKSNGYVAVQQNTQSNFFFTGMQLPILQVGDTVRAGMAVAQIPDLIDWEVSARIGELDRGHLSVGQDVEITVVALPEKKYKGKVKNIGGTTGPPWDRRFECRTSIDNASPELRPGMTATIVITTGVLSDALWVPSQALFESDGRTFVYVQSASGFVPADVKLVRRSESQVVLTGLAQGQVVALASPEQQTERKSGGGVMKAIPKS